MIIDDLRREILNALSSYLKKFQISRRIPKERSDDIGAVKNILKLENPILIRHQLNRYLNNSSIPFLSFLLFIDVNHFVYTLKEVLNREKFQEVSLLRTLVEEKEQIIASFQKLKLASDSKKAAYHMEAMQAEIKLLRSENNFLYLTIESLDKKLSKLEAEHVTQEVNKINLTSSKQLMNNRILASKSTSTFESYSNHAP